MRTEASKKKEPKVLKRDFRYFLDQYLKNKQFFLGIIRAKEAEWFNAHLPYKHPILDLGCGDGFFTSQVFKSSNRRQKRDLVDIGLEINSKLARMAEQEGCYRKVVVYDGRIIPFNDGFFSTVISNCVLEHVKDLDFNLSEIYRVLKKEGRAYLSVMTDKYDENLFGSLFLGGLYRKWMKYKAAHVHLPSKEEWVKKFLETGFKLLESEGYADKSTTRFYDIAQYLSIPNILSYQFFKIYIKPYSKLLSFLFINKIINLIGKNDRKPYSGYLFILEK